MIIDKFGRVATSERGGLTYELKRRIDSTGLPTTPDGDYNIENKRLRNVATALEDADCVNKVYVDMSIDALTREIKSYIYAELRKVTTATHITVDEAKAQLTQELLMLTSRIDKVEQKLQTT